MQAYAPLMPRDRGNEPIPDVPPAAKALKVWGVGSAVSSVITLQDGTSMLDITAVGGSGLVLRFIPLTETAGVGAAASVIASGATANFDISIPANWRQRVVIPQETFGTSSVVGINKQAGLYNRVAWIGVGVPQSSILAAEF